MKERVITGAVLIALFSYPIYSGSYLFFYLFFILALIGINEYARMMNLNKKSPLYAASIVAVNLYFIPLLLLEYEYFQQSALIFLLLFSLCAIVFNEHTSFPEAGIFFFGTSYIILGFSALVESRLENGFVWFATIIALIAVTDSFAYLIGRKFGKKKLIEKISPNKTVEGFIGGIVVGLIFTLTIQYFTEIFSSYLIAFTISIVISVTGQIGDLIESSMKRHFNVKDSGKIFPGHGGVLDRTDSWLFVFLLLGLLGFF